MKLFAQILLIIFLINFKIIAGEFSGAGLKVKNVLKRQNINLKALERSGHGLLFGENTGAGMKVNLARVKYIITQNQAYSLNNVTHINFLQPSAAKSLRDVKILEFDTKKVRTLEIKGLIIKK